MALIDGLHACKHGDQLSVPPPARQHAAGEATPAAPHFSPLPPLIPINELLEAPEAVSALGHARPEEAAALLRVARWSRDFLTHPHPELGRPGQVCPYVSSSIRERRFLLTFIRNAASATGRAEEALLQLCDYFVQMEPTCGRQTQRKTIVVLFPDLPTERTGELINGMHQRLKPHFLSRGLMLGEFYAKSEKRGLHSSQFRPLRSDTPLLVIRAMVLTDIAFLCDDPLFVRRFLDTFAERGCDEVLSYMERKREDLTEAQLAMLLGQVASARAAESVVRQTQPPRQSSHAARPR